jgi:acyl carrier protein
MQTEAKIDTICKAIVKVMQHTLTLPVDLELGSDTWDLPFTGQHFRIAAIDLAYLFFALEKEFGLRFDENALMDYRFNTVNGIAATINRLSETS